MNLPTILEAAGRLQMEALAGHTTRGGPNVDVSPPGASKPQYEFLMPVARTLDSSFLEQLIADHAGAKSLRKSVHLVPDALPALHHSRAGIVASGTATVEAALMGTPFVMVYRVSPLTYALGKPRVKVPYFAMVNLIAQEEVVPELVQDKFTIENIASEMDKIISDGEPRTRMIERLSAVRGRLRHANGAVLPAEAAAEIILRMAPNPSAKLGS
jgi:lipid-A-disaccharide synthase